MTAVFVMDTSYLLELFDVPGCSEPDAVTEVRRRYEEAVEGDARIFVPLPCLFELANHIAGVPHGGSRQKLADHLSRQVVAAIEGDGEWILLPMREIRHYRRLWELFARVFAVQGVGLTDTCIIEEARRLKRERYHGQMFTVHIWTKDGRLKAHEPDTEVAPFVG